MLVIGVDTGGTFTDFIWKDDDQWGEYKLLSTPANPAEAVLEGINHIAAERDYSLVHGSTVATNAILEKRGALTALVTNQNFEDVIEIARQNRGQLYNFFYRKNPPLIPRELRFGLPGRVNQAGEIIEELTETDIETLLEPLTAAQVESIAVSFLFSFNNPGHELKVRKVLSRLGIPISLSHETLAEFREFERTSTTVINAYVSPKMRRYITFLSERIGDQPFRIMQSNGGSISAETAMRESVRTILSGPAGGAVGAFEFGKMAGFPRLISFDMGGTSTDVALIDGKLPLTMESSIAEYPVKVPMIDIHTVGAGGGSIASIDAGGSLKVGPESAGADPGPICYGKGSEITVTDANLFLGRLIPDHFLGGNMELEFSTLNNHFKKLATKLNLITEELAEGVLNVANTTMERAIKVISVERGFDPREFTLFSFGGAGGLHAAYLARDLNMTQVFIPRNPGILSAAGMLMSDVIKDYSQTVMLSEGEIVQETLNLHFNPLENRGREDLLKEGVEEERVELERYLDMRYQGQSYEIMVPYGADFCEQFHQLHEKTYGYCNRNKDIEVVNVRLRALGKPEKP
ncbi:MAG: hydantoinase/oxoprolinase family protein, partial [Deltaproteobacteria bacterium]|nr:hydantoinase/oxoprolinase family protein [Deltaproteobacteria bacterium]